MKKNDSIILVAFIGAVLILLVMITATYAYFSVDIRGSGSNLGINSTEENLEITFGDTSTIAMVDAYTGDSITKTVSVSNTGDYPLRYNIVLEELVNNFENPSDLVYSITSTGGGVNKLQTVMPNTNNASLVENILLEPTQVHVYTIIVKFLKTNGNQNNNMNKTFSAKITVSGSKEMYEDASLFASNTLGRAITTNNSILSDNDVDFSVVPISNGLYYTNNSINGSTVYYFRGSSTINNNVIFAGKCWKIIRTTEDLGIRIIYNGVPNSNTCTSPTNLAISNKKYNLNSNYNSYIGFKYGSPNSSSYNSEHTNTNKSNIKNELDTWFTNNLNTYTSYIQDSYYCNNRLTKGFLYDGNTYTDYGYGNTNTGYDSFDRLNVNESVIPNLDCYNKNDIFTVTNTRGNAEGTTHPIGLITADETVLSGISPIVSYNNSYLNNGLTYWTMTPSYYYSNDAYNYYINNGTLSTNVVSNELGLRPVVTLKKDTVLLSGNGSASTPYRITN